jgi:hypothetical protein
MFPANRGNKNEMEIANRTANEYLRVSTPPLNARNALRLIPSLSLQNDDQERQDNYQNHNDSHLHIILCLPCYLAHASLRLVKSSLMPINPRVNLVK